MGDSDTPEPARRQLSGNIHQRYRPSVISSIGGIVHQRYRPSSRGQLPCRGFGRKVLGDTRGKDGTGPRRGLLAVRWHGRALCSRWEAAACPARAAGCWAARPGALQGARKWDLKAKIKLREAAQGPFPAGKGARPRQGGQHGHVTESPARQSTPDNRLGFYLM